jgi:ATP-binding cassette subfamily B protein
MSQPETHIAIHPALAGLPIFDFMAPEVRSLVAASFVPVHFAFGDVIVREGDEADAYYILATGRARALKMDERGEEVPLNTLGPGDGFGEGALIGGTKRTATVRASGETEALRLDRSIFQALVAANSDIRRSFELHMRRRELSNFFRLYTAFPKLPADALAKVLDSLEPVAAAEGEVVMRQGDPAGPMYFVESGRLRAYKETSGHTRDVGYLRTGDFFGELSLLRKAGRDASVQAITSCRLLRLSEPVFDELLATQPEFKKGIDERVAQYEYLAQARVPLDFAEEILPSEAGATEAAAVPTEEAAALVEAPSEESELAARGPRKRRRRYPVVMQLDEMDCGAACLATVCRGFGRRVDVGHIRRLVHTGPDGTSLLGLCQGAEGLGLDARAVKVSRTRAHELPTPSILHWRGNHWVVAFDTGGKKIGIADPARGVRRVSDKDLQSAWTGFAAVIEETPALADAPVASSSLSWAMPIVRPYLRRFLGAAVLALMAAGFGMALPVFGQLVIDRVVGQRESSLLGVLLLGMLGVLLLMTGASVVQRLILSRVAVKFDSTALDVVTGRLLGLGMSYFGSRRTGDISRRLSGIQSARDFLVQNGVRALTALTQLLVAIALMLVYSRLLALVFLAVTPLYALLMRYASRRLRPLFDTLEEAYGRYHSAQIDAIKGIETVKALGAEESLRERMLAQFNSVSRVMIRADFALMLYEAVIQLLTFSSLALFLWVGAVQVLHGNLSVGQMVAFNALVLLANGPIMELMALWDQMQQATILLNRINDVFETEPEQGADKSRLMPVRSLAGHVRFQNVGFTYGGPGSRPVLEEITLDVPPGRTVAIVGRSGSGKTTLVKCLAGLLEPTDGTILYDGADLRTLDYRQLRKQIGFVLQENYLFDDTIARNIAFGDEQPEMERVVWAAQVANAHDFIDRLPLGYDTRVGETGITLSGGQRQRVAIARALYPRPPVLIFDEATSSLDTESERAVQENMAELLAGQTTFVIAHRLSTIRDMDVIIVIEKGRLVERGTHEELMSRRGLYYYLCSQQLGL